MTRKPGSDRTSLVAVLLAACVGACGDKPEPRTNARVRLFESTEGELVPAQTRAAGEVLFADDFADGIGTWTLATDAAHPLQLENGILSVESGSDGSGAFLTLAGRRGSVFRIVEVEPASCYLFTARVRAHDIVAPEPFFGATMWLAELTRSGTPAELLGDDPTRWISTRHLFETAAGTEGWQPRERLFCTGPDTRALLVAANLSFDSELTSGSLDVADVRLERKPLRAAWDQSLAPAVRDMAAGEPPRDDWRAERLVRGHLGAEVRPSVVGYPDERMRFSVDVPTGTPVFETGIGVWSPALLPGGPRAQSYALRVDGAEVWRLDHAAPAELRDARWRDVEVDLTAFAGERVSLELCFEGELPGLFGAPVVRDTSARPDKPNVLLISIDTLRADHVGSYGAPGNPTPNLDRFAREGIRFAHVDGQAPYTLPGHATMLSGQFPSVHGVQRTTHAFSSERSPLLARILSDRGYRTQAFTGGGFVNADFGFDKGFDGFANIDPLRQRDAYFFRAIVKNDPGAVRRLLRNRSVPPPITRELIDEYGPEHLGEWLADHRDEPFFLFVHTYLVHDYDPPDAYLSCREDGCTSTRKDYEEHRLGRKLGWNPQPISDADRAHLIHLYDATLRFCDKLIGDLLGSLDELGLRDNTIVAITTDHGEEMFERGFMQHGKTLYEELTDLPMLFRIPGEAPRVIEEPAMLIDLTPTILGALGIPLDPRMQGRNWLAPDSIERATWSEIHDDFVHKYALRQDGWKLIWAPHDDEVDFPAENEWELFDLTRDAGERSELSASEPERFRELRAQIEKQRTMLAEYGSRLGAMNESDLDENTRDMMKQLGYVDGE